MAKTTVRLVHLIIYICLNKNIQDTAARQDNESSILNANTSETFQRDLPDLASLCPYNRFCSSPPLEDNLRIDQQPCCERCSCEHDCHETGSCCPDMPVAGIGKPKYPCIRLSDLAKHADIRADRVTDVWYHVVTDCSDIESALAYPNCYKPTEVQDFVIVSDPKHGRVYRNKHCAECNEVKNYINWTLRATCPDMSSLMYVQSFEERERYLMKNCKLLSLPPAGHSADMSYCLPNSSLISTCNTTGKWDIYDKGIEDACMKHREDQNAYFTKDRDEKDIPFVEVYASVYCYLCNVPKNSKKVDTCKMRNKIKEDNVERRRLSLFAILDAKMWKDDLGIHDDYRCRSTDIWDPFTELCRPVSCPIGTVPVHGRCKMTFSTFDGYTVLIYFEVIFRSGSMADNNNLLQVLENRIFRELGNDLTCGKCKSALLRDIYSSKLFVGLIVFSTEKCPTDTLLKRIQKLAFGRKMYLKYRYKGQQIRIELVLVFKILENKQSEYLEQTHPRSCDINRILDPSIFEYCPKITLTKNETYNLGLSNHPESSLTVSAQVNATEFGFKQVCVDTYFLAHEAKSRAVSTYGHDYEHTQGIWLRLLLICVGNFSIQLWINLNVQFF